MMMKYKYVGFLSVGHFVTDINQGALPALLPFFIATYDLTYAAAAGIVFAANMASTIVQPLFGHAADRFSKPWFLSAGLLLAGLGMALTGVLQSYHMILLVAVFSGIGIAAYHPEAARLANFAAGAKKGIAMSLFGVGGALGFAVGPLLATMAMLRWGIKGTLVLIVPVTVMAVAMMTQFSALEALEKNVTRKKADSENADLTDAWGPFSRLTLTVIGRSILFYGLNTFIPIYWINVLHESKASGAMALTIYAGAGIVGNLLGGGLADRIGQKKVVLIGFFSLTLLLPILVWVEDIRLATALLVPIGMTLYATYSPTVVLGQSYLPNRIGLSSGVTLGIAVAIGGGAAPFIGKIADLYGVWYSLASMACLPVLTVAVALTLPEPERMPSEADDRHRAITAKTGKA